MQSGMRHVAAAAAAAGMMMAAAAAAADAAAAAAVAGRLFLYSQNSKSNEYSVRAVTAQRCEDERYEVHRACCWVDAVHGHRRTSELPVEPYNAAAVGRWKEQRFHRMHENEMEPSETTATVYM